MQQLTIMMVLIKHRVRNHHFINSKTDMSGFANPWLDYSVDYFMRGNIWAGLYAIDPNGDWSIPPYFCNTGNCTWTGYSSLGVCSRCADLTPQVNKNCVRQPGIDPGNLTGCSVSLPNGFNLGGSANSRFNVMAMSTSQTPLVYVNYSSPIVIVQSIIANASFVTPNVPVNASECVLIPCVLDYKNASVNSSPTLFSYGFNGLAWIEFADRIWDNVTFNVSDSPWYGPTIDVRRDNKSRNYPTRYRMTQPAFLALKNYLTPLLSGFVSSDGNGTLSYQSDGKAHPVEASAPDAMNAIYYPPIGCTDVFQNQIYDWNMCAINNLAIAMTAMIRSQPYTAFNPLTDTNFSTYAVMGTTYYPLAIVQVKWIWIVPTAAIWLLGLILFFGVIRKTRRSGVKIWKHNALAVLFLGVGDKELDKVQSYGMTEEGLKKKAEHLQVRLHLTERQAQLL
jgi:hypothetical protein